MQLTTLRTPATALTDAGLAFGVRTQSAANTAWSGVQDQVTTRVTRLRDDGEAGSQVLEYAMVAALAAIVIAVLATQLNKGSFVGGLLDSLLKNISGLMSLWKK